MASRHRPAVCFAAGTATAPIRQPSLDLGPRTTPAWVLSSASAEAPGWLYLLTPTAAHRDDEGGRKCDAARSKSVRERCCMQPKSIKVFRRAGSVKCTLWTTGGSQSAGGEGSTRWHCRARPSIGLPPKEPQKISFKKAHLRAAEAIQHPGAPMLLVLILGNGCLPYKIKLSTSGRRTAVCTTLVAAEGSTPDDLLPISPVVVEEQRLQASYGSSSRHSEGQGMTVV